MPCDSELWNPVQGQGEALSHPLNLDHCRSERKYPPADALRTPPMTTERTQTSPSDLCRLLNGSFA